jgi:uncharacterized protein involved in exopolysaccharide biosynthesis
MLTTDTQQTVEPQIDLRTLWISIQYKLLIPIIVAIVLGVGTYKLTQIFIPKTWEASCFLIRHAKNMAAQNDMPYLYLKTDINTLLETILLRENLEKVISTMQLDISPQDLRKKIEINKTNTSNVIEIKVTWSEPALAAAIADKVSETFLQNYTQIQNSATHEIYEYYVKKRSLTLQELQKARQAERLFKTKNDVLDFETEKDNLYAYLTQLELRHVDEEVKRNDLSSQLEHISEKLATTSVKVVTSELLRTNEGNRTKSLKNELEVLRKRYTEDNPKVQHLLHQISVLEIEEQRKASSNITFDEIEYGLNPVYKELSLRELDLESQLFASYGNLASYAESIDQIKQKIEDLSSLAQVHLKLEQKTSSKQDLIDTLDTRLVEANLALESNISDFDILERAQTPEFPKRSFRKVISLALALFSSGIIAVYILIKEVTNTSLKTANDLKRLEGANVIAVLPDKDEVSAQLFYSQFQLLFSEIAHALSGTQGKLVVVTGMAEGEGTTFIASEIASQFAKQGKRVLHIESEEYTNEIDPSSIINALLYGDKDLTNHQFSEFYENLYKNYFSLNEGIYLDMLSDEKTQTFLAHCYKQFDVVIWDLLPCNRHLQLFRTVTQQAQFNLLLTKSRTTPIATMKQVIAMMNTWNIKNIGVLINSLPKRYINQSLNIR